MWSHHAVGLFEWCQRYATRVLTGVLTPDKPHFTQGIFEDLRAVKETRLDDGLIKFIVVIVIAYFEEDGIGTCITFEKDIIIKRYL